MDGPVSRPAPAAAPNRRARGDSDQIGRFSAIWCLLDKQLVRFASRVDGIYPNKPRYPHGQADAPLGASGLDRETTDCAQLL